MSDQLTELLNTLSTNIAQSLTTGTDVNGSDPLQGSNRISESSSHDFTDYLFALDPLTRNTIGAALSREEEELFLVVIAAVVKATVPVIYQIEIQVLEGDYDGPSVGTDVVTWDREKDALYNSDVLAQKLFRTSFMQHSLSYLSGVLGSVEEVRRPGYLLELATAFRDNLAISFNQIEWPEFIYEKVTIMRSLTEDSLVWRNAALKAASDVSPEASNDLAASKTETFGFAEFTPFEPQTVNFGVQLVYRQVWLPKGVQTGDIVKTIPLGPGQKEKVIIKSVRREQRKRSFENKRTVEQSSENVSSSRDSSEVVGEASSRSNWNVEVSAEASFGYGKAGLSASTGGEQSQSSRESKSRANEAMQKAADKLRTETKVVVESESESTDSIERVSEIHNANDETAVTYVYSKLQRQYQVYTYLAEVNTVAYVAERVISDTELSHAWFERYATVMRGALLDASLENDLELILSRAYFLEGSPSNAMTEGDIRINAMMDKLVSKGLPDHSKVPGTPPDTVSSLLAQYQSDKSEAMSAYNDRQSYQQSLQRLIAHVSDNALHYSKAIWASEAADMRMMRYRNILVPQDWRETNPVGTGYGNQNSTNPNIFVPVVSEESPLVRLTDMINPAGPVGLAGNYLVFDLKESQAIKHIDAPLSLLRSSYTQKITWFEPTDNFNFVGLLRPSYAYPSQEISITITGMGSSSGDAEVRVALFSIASDGSLDNLGEETLTVASGGRLEGANISGVILKDGEPISVLTSGIVIHGKSVLTSQLEDPDFSDFKYRQYAHTFSNAQTIISGDVISTLHEQYTQELTALDLDASLSIGDLSIESLAALVDIYLMDEFITSNTRRVLLDTDNVVLSRVVDNATSLEPYKASHRQIDLLKTIEELKQGLSETERYGARIDAQNFDDPQVDTRILVEGDTDIAVDPQP